MATSSDYRIKLALTLIEDHFGEITKDVAAALITTQSATLAQVVRICGQLFGVRQLSSKQVKEALLVLLHHNCLLVELAPEVKVEGDAPLVAADRLKPTGLIYRLSLETVINRMRFSKFASHAQSLFEGIAGDIAGYVIEEFAIHGRRKLWQLRQDLSVKMVDKENEDAQSQRMIQAEAFVAEHSASMGTEAATEAAHEQFLSVVPNAANSPERKERLQTLSDEIAKVCTDLCGRRLLVAVPFLDIHSQQQERLASSARTLYGLNPNAAAAATAPPKSTTTIKATSKSSATTSSVSVSVIAGGKRKRVVDDEEEEFDAPMTNQGKGQSKGVSMGLSAMDGVSVKVEKGVGMEAEMGVGGAGGEGDMFDEAGGVDAGEVEELNVGIRMGVGEEVVWMVGWDQYIQSERHRLCMQVAEARGDPPLTVSVIKHLLDASLQQSHVGVSFLHIVNTILGTNYNSYAAARSSSSAAASSAASAAAGGEGNATSKKKPTTSSKKTSASSSSSSSSATTAASTDADTTTAASSSSSSEHSVDEIHALLSRLCSDSSTPLLMEIPGGPPNEGPAYTVRVSAIVEKQRQRCLHDICLQRYGLCSARILSLLLDKPHLEQQQIADLAIVPAREARERLYKMFRDGWVDYLEISKRSDFNPTSTNFFWHTGPGNRPLRTAIQHTYKAVFNVHMQRGHYYATKKEILQYHSPDDGSILGNQYHVFVGAMGRLDLALLQLDDTLMLLESF